jgi:hypothetical protein
MVYEIWDIDSGNRLGGFDTQDAALVEVKHAPDHHGEAYVASLLLDAEDDQGRTRLIAEGIQLVALARGLGPADGVKPKETTRTKPQAG